MKPILGSIVALVTPMNEDGSIDYPALRPQPRRVKPRVGGNRGPKNH